MSNPSKTSALVFRDSRIRYSHLFDHDKQYTTLPRQISSVRITVSSNEELPVLKNLYDTQKEILNCHRVNIAGNSKRCPATLKPAS